jgi:hypothetical protein
VESLVCREAAKLGRVRSEEAEGEQGPQASTVQVVNKPGIRLPTRGAVSLAPPRGWEDAGAAGARSQAPLGDARPRRRSRADRA